MKFKIVSGKRVEYINSSASPEKRKRRKRVNHRHRKALAREHHG